MVSNIKNNTIGEIDAKKDLNALNEIKNVEEIKYKNRTPKQKGLLILFDDLFNIVLTDKTLESESQENKNKKVESKKVESKKEENKYEDDCYEYDDEKIDQNKIMKDLNDSLDEIIDKSKSFEDQIKLLKKLGQEEYFFKKDFDNKELKFKILKIQLANISNEIDKKLFKQIFGHILIKLADNLINTTNKEENQTTVKNINKKI